MSWIKQINSLNGRIFMIDENFEILITKQEQIYLMPIISDCHYKGGLLVKHTYSFF